MQPSGLYSDAVSVFDIALCTIKMVESGSESGQASAHRRYLSNGTESVRRGGQAGERRASMVWEVWDIWQLPKRPGRLGRLHNIKLRNRIGRVRGARVGVRGQGISINFRLKA